MSLFIFFAFFSLLADPVAAGYTACSSVHGCCTLTGIQNGSCKLNDGNTISVGMDSSSAYEVWITDPGIILDNYGWADLMTAKDGCYYQTINNVGACNGKASLVAYPPLAAPTSGEYTISGSVSGVTCTTQQLQCGDWQILPNYQLCSGGPAIMWMLKGPLYSITACLVADTIGSFVGKGGYHLNVNTKAIPSLEQFSICPTGTTPDSCALVNCGAHGVCNSGQCRCSDGYSGPYCQYSPAPTTVPPSSTTPTTIPAPPQDTPCAVGAAACVGAPSQGTINGQTVCCWTSGMIFINNQCWCEAPTVRPTMASTTASTTAHIPTTFHPSTVPGQISSGSALSIPDIVMIVMGGCIALIIVGLVCYYRCRCRCHHEHKNGSELGEELLSTNQV